MLSVTVTSAFRAASESTNGSEVGVYSIALDASSSKCCYETLVGDTESDCCETAECRGKR